MKEFVKKHLGKFFVVLVLSYIVIVNYQSGTVIMGLDNASPYFCPIDVIHKIVGFKTFVYGGLFPVLPVFAILHFVGLSPGVVSYMYIFTNLVLGAFGVGLLSRYIAERVCSTKNNALSVDYKETGFVFACLYFVVCLFTIWIFAHPNFLFMASYSSIPWLVYLFVSRSKYKRFHFFLLLTFFSLIFLITFLNIVAFLSYLIQIFLLVLIVEKVLVPPQCGVRNVLKKLIKWTIVLLTVWIVLLQGLSFLNGGNRFIINDFKDYVQLVSEDSLTDEITSDLSLSESRSSIQKSIRFATAWIELHDINGKPIFEFYDLYTREILFVILGLLPFVLSLIPLLGCIFYRKKGGCSNVWILSLLQFVGLVLISEFGIYVFRELPLFHDAFRWSSSKFWPVYIIPLMILASVGVVQIIQSLDSKLGNLAYVKYIFLSLLGLGIFVYGFPLWSGHMFSSSVIVDLPLEYYSLRDKMSSTSRVLYLPPPQKLYFRQYDWGYYGSSFLIYLVPSEIIDGGVLTDEFLDYSTIVEQYKLCDSDVVSDIDYILVDKTVKDVDFTDYLLPDCLLKDYDVLVNNEYYLLYKRVYE